MGTKVEQAEPTFKSDDQGRTVLIVGTERLVLGPKGTIAEAMCRYLAEEDYGECA
jgi:hypothetical protein